MSFKRSPLRSRRLHAALGPQGSRRRRLLPLGALVLALVVAAAVAAWQPTDSEPVPVTLSELEAAIDDEQIASAKLSDGRGEVVITRHDGTEEIATYPEGYGADLAGRLIDADVKVEASGGSDGSGVATELALRLVPLLLVGSLLVWYLARSGALSTVRAGGQKASPVAIPPTRFADVAGCDEVIGELHEVVQYLRDPDRFATLGARHPKGVLLSGPPGTGKTLLARAVAGEAGVPFFALSGSDFTEMYVGVGAKRVRELFAKARAAEEAHGGAIIFIDELDACGRARSTGQSSGGNEERESTLNQLLVEMDGFGIGSRILTLAATNRPDILDSALTRPGRFDRRIEVPAPDRRGREAILALHMAASPVGPDVDPASIARRTAGMTGAELANLVNQAAMAAARREGASVSAADLDDALARVVLGPERRSALVSERDRRITAWHEAGHAVVALLHPACDDPVSVTIVPRGGAGGVTWLSGSDHQFLTLSQARAQLDIAMGGRAGEELLCGDDITQGAASDFRAATDLARRMVTEYGMSSIGAGCFDQTVIGEGGAEAVFFAVKAELDDALGRARQTMVDHRGLVEALADRLLEDETVGREELRELRDGAALLEAPAPLAG